MRTQTTKYIGGLLVAGLLALPSLVQAQPAAHYGPGTEGIMAATLPPPGIYIRDYNAFYFADQFNNAQGNKEASPKVFVYANAPRLIWITDLKVLGGYLGVDGLLPIQYTDVKGMGQTFGMGDAFFEGTWSSHLTQWDLSLGAGAWAPTGSTTPNNYVIAGNGFWGEMLTAGATWYPDQAKRWALSVLNRYEFNQEQEDTHITPGQVYTVEGGLSYGILKTVAVGPIGYYQQQVTASSGPHTTGDRNQVAGIGPEISAFFPSITFGVSLRYAYEFEAESRLQGNTITLTLTKRL